MFNNKMIEREVKAKMIDFLMGLNPKYNNLTKNILAMNPLPSINNKAIQLVQQAEK